MDSISYTIAADCALHSGVGMVQSLFDEAKSKGLNIDAHFYGVLLRAYFREAKWKEMASLYEEVGRGCFGVNKWRRLRKMRNWMWWYLH
jgi:hypothetical protein